MDTELIKYLRDFLVKNDIDGLIVNSTNEFLVEYNMLELNSRYHLTEFTGSTGDALITKDTISLFVDTRYHEQADNQVNHDYIDVVKIPLDKSYLTALTENIPAYFKLGLISAKTSKKFYEALLEKLNQKNVSIKLFTSDPVAEYKKSSALNVSYNVFQVDKSITGCSSDEKFNILKSYAGDKFNVIVTSLEDIAYLTNMRSYDFDYSAVFPSKALITQDGVKIFSDCKIPCIGNSFEVLPLSKFEHAIKCIQKEELYVDENQLTINDYKLINQNNTILQSHLNLFKTVKNESETAHLKKCFERADNALKTVYEMINSEVVYSEYDYYEALIKAMKDNGALSLSFKPIVAAGSNTSIIHYSMPSKTKQVNNGDFLLVDYGGYYEGGMATDTTRTFIKGTPSNEQKRAYTVVLKAFLNAYFNEYHKKSSYYDIDKIARETINKNITSDFSFAHSTGHGVGISVHEIPPRVSSGDISKTKILENTVFSIEPGVYKEGWGGIRLENTVCAKYENDKIKMHSFSHFPFEIKLVDLSMMNDYEKYYYMKWQAEACIQ